MSHPAACFQLAIYTEMSQFGCQYEQTRLGRESSGCVSEQYD